VSGLSTRSLRPTRRRGSSSWRPRPRPAWPSSRFVHPLVGRDGETLAMDVARDGPRMRPPAAGGVQRLPRRRGLLRQRRAGACAARRRLARSRRPGRCGGAVHPCAESARFFAPAARHAGKRRPEPQLPGLRRAAAGQRRLRGTARPAAARAWPPDAEVQAAIGRYVQAHGMLRFQAAVTQGQHAFPTACSLAAAQPDLEQLHVAPGVATACRQGPAHGLDRPAHRPGPERLGERILRARNDAATLQRARAVVGRQRQHTGHVVLRRILLLGPADGHDVNRSTTNARRPGTPASRWNTARCRCQR
jgi:hypothetical protein